MADARTYLDYNASAPLLPDARAAAVAALDLVGNASSVHAEGRRLQRILEGARSDLASLIGCAAGEIVFTSGATEANATALAAGFAVAYRPGIEHESVLAPIAASRARVIDMPVGPDGVVDVAGFARLLEGDGPVERGVVAIQLANNETGVIQPVGEIAALARRSGLHVHCDAVQAPGRIPVDVRALDVDTLTVSAHKMGGPRGVGALFIRDGVAIPALIAGGGQERRRRAGTENVAGIAGFGAACRIASQGLFDAARVAGLRDALEIGVSRITPAAVVIGKDAPRLPNTSAFGLPGRAAETLLINLDLAGLAVSAGAACSSGKVGTSHVLAAMGVEPDLARGVIRVSLGAGTSMADVEYFLSAWRDISSRAAGDLSGRQRTIDIMGMAGRRASLAVAVTGD